MSDWSRADPDAYLRLDLHAHLVLQGVPLHDVWRVALPRGGSGRTIADVRSLVTAEPLRLGPVVRGLFGLRTWLGSLFGWDSLAATPEDSLFDRVPEELRRRSVPPPGSHDGPFVLLYGLERESVSEIRNATVHAFSVGALDPTAGGYTLYWAVYVRPVGRVTRVYMALIDPFRRMLVYPAILRGLHDAWVAKYGGSAE